MVWHIYLFPNIMGFNHYRCVLNHIFFVFEITVIPILFSFSIILYHFCFRWKNVKDGAFPRCFWPFSSRSLHSTTFPDAAPPNRLERWALAGTRRQGSMVARRKPQVRTVAGDSSEAIRAAVGAEFAGVAGRPGFRASPLQRFGTRTNAAAIWQEVPDSWLAGAHCGAPVSERHCAAGPAHGRQASSWAPERQIGPIIQLILFLGN